MNLHNQRQTTTFVFVLCLYYAPLKPAVASGSSKDTAAKFSVEFGMMVQARENQKVVAANAINETRSKVASTNDMAAKFSVEFGMMVQAREKNKDMAVNAINKTRSKMRSDAMDVQPAGLQPGVEPYQDAAIIDASIKPKTMDAINKYRAKICSDMKNEHGIKFGSFDACEKFMRNACHPGRDGRMDGDGREVSSGEGYCENFFDAEKEEAEHSTADGKEKAIAGRHERGGRSGTRHATDVDSSTAGGGVPPSPSGIAGAPSPAAAYRPTEGDTVTILSTRNTKDSFPEGIGKVFAIQVDKHNDQPYQVEGSRVWLYEEDVRLAKKKVLAADEKWYYKNGGIDPGRYHMDEKLKLPTQGYWGKLVEHEDMATSVGDWQQERPMNGPSRRKICTEHPENVWCQRYVDSLDAMEPRPRASATMIRHSMLTLAIVFACAVGR